MLIKINDRELKLYNRCNDIRRRVLHDTVFLKLIGNSSLALNIRQDNYRIIQQTSEMENYTVIQISP